MGMSPVESFCSVISSLARQRQLNKKNLELLGNLLAFYESLAESSHLHP
jgi:hypothetical protein